MNYDELKELSPDNLVEYLKTTLNNAGNIRLTRALESDPLEEPTLALIGDFEIRARFPK